MNQIMSFVALYVLAVAGDDQYRTVYHDRIDGYLMPICERIARPWR